MSTHAKFGYNRTIMMDTLHKDLHAFLRTSQLVNKCCKQKLLRQTEHVYYNRYAFPVTLTGFEKIKQNREENVPVLLCYAYIS
jgi:hypothetical protein